MITLVQIGNEVVNYLFVRRGDLDHPYKATTEVDKTYDIPGSACVLMAKQDIGSINAEQHFVI